MLISSDMLRSTDTASSFPFFAAVPAEEICDLDERQSLAAQCDAEGKDVVQESVHLALFTMQNGRRLSERRLEARHPYPYPIYLTPVDMLESPILDDTFVVLGRHLSDHGLDFYHREPLGGRHFIASLPMGAVGWVGFMLELNWTRFSRHGWYDNGGKFLRTLASPLPPRKV